MAEGRERERERESESAHVSTDAHRNKRMAADPQELELQAVVSCPLWVLGTEFRSSARAVSAFNQGATSPAQRWNIWTSGCFFLCFLQVCYSVLC